MLDVAAHVADIISALVLGSGGIFLYKQIKRQEQSSHVGGVGNIVNNYNFSDKGTANIYVTDKYREEEEIKQEYYGKQ